MNINVSLFVLSLLLIASLTYVQSNKSGFVNSPKSNAQHHHRDSSSKLQTLKETSKSSSNLNPNLSSTANSLFGKSLEGLRPVVNELKIRLSSKLIRNVKHKPSSSNVNQIKFYFPESKRLNFKGPFEVFKTSLMDNYSKSRLRHQDIKPVSASSYKRKHTVLSPYEKSKPKRPSSYNSKYAKSASEKHEVDDMIRGSKHRPYRGPTKYSVPSNDYEDQDYKDDVKYSQKDAKDDDEQEQNYRNLDYEEPSDEYTQPHQKQPPNRNSFLKDFEESDEENFGDSHEPKKIRDLEQGVEYGVEALAERQAERHIEQAMPGGVPYESYEQGSDSYPENENENDPYSNPYSSDYDNDYNYGARQKSSFNNFFAPEPKLNSNQYWNNPMQEMGEAEMEYLPNVIW